MKTIFHILRIPLVIWNLKCECTQFVFFLYFYHHKKFAIYIPIITYGFKSVCKVSITYGFEYICKVSVTYGFLHTVRGVGVSFVRNLLEGRSKKT